MYCDRICSLRNIHTFLYIYVCEMLHAFDQKHIFWMDFLVTPIPLIIIFRFFINMQVSNILDPDRGRPDLGPNCLQRQGCGNTMPDLSNLVPFHSGQVKNFNLLVLGQVQMYEYNSVFYILINYLALKTVWILISQLIWIYTVYKGSQLISRWSILFTRIESWSRLNIVFSVNAYPLKLLDVATANLAGASIGHMM